MKKQRILKKGLAFVLSLAFVFSSMTGFVFAEETGNEPVQQVTVLEETNASLTLTADGQTIVISESEMKEAEAVTVEESNPWTYGNNQAFGTFYSFKNILEMKGIDVSGCHGIKFVASDGFTTAVAQENLDALYIFDMSEVSRGGSYGAAGTFGTAINGAAGNKWGTDIVAAEVANDHVWFVKKGACKHYCAICDAEEPSVTFNFGDGQSIAIPECEIKSAAAEVVTEEAPWFYNETNPAFGTFYSVKSILETAGIDVSECHGVKFVARDGFTTGISKDEIDSLYIYDMSEVTKNGTVAGNAGTFGLAINGSAGNKWGNDIVLAEVVTDHVWFIKKGACKHYCAICGEDEPVQTVWNWDGVEGATLQLVYSDCGDAASEALTAVITEKETKAATTSSKGEITYTATVTYEDETYTDTQTVETPALPKTNIKDAVVTGLSSKTFTGKALTPTPVVKVGSKKLTNNKDYKLTYSGNKNVGTAKVKITGIGDYTGSLTKTFKIVKAKQNPTIKVTKSKQTVKLATVKKKNVAIKKAFTVNSTKGTVTYKKIKGNSKIVVNAKTGVITVKKGLKKGTYTIKVKVAAKGTANYKAISKTLSLKIVVK